MFWYSLFRKFLKCLHFCPFIVYSILVGLYYTFRLNYAWLFLNDPDSLGKSEGTKIFVYLIGAFIAILVLIPIFIKFMRITKAMRVIVKYNENASRSFKISVRAIIGALLIEPFFPVYGIYIAFDPPHSQYIAIGAIFGLASSVLYVIAFTMLNKALLTLREQGLYGSNVIKEIVTGPYIIAGSLIFYMLIDAIFVTLGLSGYSILAAIFFVAYVTGYIVFVVGLDKFSNNIEFIKEKFD